MPRREDQFGRKLGGKICKRIYPPTDLSSNKEVYVYLFEKERGLSKEKELYALKERRLVYRREKYDDYTKEDEDYEEYKQERNRRLIEAQSEADKMYKFRNAPYIINYIGSEICDWIEDNEFGCSFLILTPLMMTLDEQIKAGKVFTEDEVITIGSQIGTALKQFHDQNYLHQDVKPSNIFINDQGNYVLGDFDSTRPLRKSQLAGTLYWTPEFAAPEQVGHQIEKCDYRTDIYCLGLTLYLLCNDNCLPFSPKYGIAGEDVATACKKRENGETLPPLNCISKSLEDVIFTACAYKQEDRYQNIQDFLNDLIWASHNSAEKFKRGEYKEPLAFEGRRPKQKNVECSSQKDDTDALQRAGSSIEMKRLLKNDIPVCVTSPISGTVTWILSAGDTIYEGWPFIELEVSLNGFSLEYKLRAPEDIKVTSTYISKGDTVDIGTPLAEIIEYNFSWSDLHDRRICDILDFQSMLREAKSGDVIAQHILAHHYIRAIL